MRDKKIQSLALFIVLISTFLQANPPAFPGDYVPPDSLKAAYITRFPEFTEWPARSSLSDPKTPFTIGVVGNTPIYPYLVENSRKMQIKDKNVKVLNVSDISQIKNCHMVFIARANRHKINRIISSIGNLPILTIGDTEDYENKGIMINIFNSGEHLRFNVNWKAAKKSGITLTSTILCRARKIIKN